MKRALQIALAIFSLIPLYFAVIGIWQGAGGVTGEAVPAGVDNQFRYLSGIYLIVTFSMWWIIPRIETSGAILRILVAGIFIGGIARYISHTTVGPGLDFQFTGMIIELVSPIFVIWQSAIAKRA